METWTRHEYKDDTQGYKKRVYVKCIGYEPREAAEAGIDYVSNYVELNSHPGYFLSDDGMVLHCFKVTSFAGKYTKRTITRYHTDVGVLTSVTDDVQQKVIRTVKCSFAIFKASGYKMLYTKNDYRKKYRKNARVKAMVKMYAVMITSSQRVDYNLLARTVSPSERLPIAKVKHLLRLSEVRAMVDTELSKQIKSLGIDITNVVAKFEEAYNVAKTKKDAQSMIRVAENYMEALKKVQPEGMTPEGTGPEIPAGELAAHIDAAENELNKVTTNDVLRKEIDEMKKFQVEQDEYQREAALLLEKPILS